MTAGNGANARPPIDPMSFETAMAELETIVRELESGKTSLEDSIAAYERGVALKTHCEKKLKDAQLRVSQITVSPDGSLTETPFNTTD